MIKHDMGDAIPPTNKQLWIVEWMSKRPGEEPTSKTIMVPAGMPVSENLRDEYRCALKMHNEFAAVCKRNGVALPTLFMIVPSNELIGLSCIPDDQQVAIADRTGAPVMGIGERH
jgi:hypothetical protein